MSTNRKQQKLAAGMDGVEVEKISALCDAKINRGPRPCAGSWVSTAKL
jgi:hypothetical protein